MIALADHYSYWVPLVMICFNVCALWWVLRRR